MRNRRPLLSFTLLGGAVLLLVAIAVGQRLGDTVLHEVTEQRSAEAGPILTPVPQTSVDPNDTRNWKTEQVVTAATDPAFPDPRATPTPQPHTPPPTARPTPPPPTAAPSIDPDATATPVYTSPPLPLPIASHSAQDIETEPPDANGYPQGIPPVTPEPSPTH
jgi:hypothetical protein